MIFLDTDHLSILTMPGRRGHSALLQRLEDAVLREEIGVPIVSMEEQLRGWLAVIRRSRHVREQVNGYEQLGKVFDFAADWKIVPFDENAAQAFERLRRSRVRVGSADLKIAAIALTNNAKVQSANIRDFRQVTELTVENWLI